jgi:hypothetical protein
MNSPNRNNARKHHFASGDARAHSSGSRANTRLFAEDFALEHSLKGASMGQSAKSGGSPASLSAASFDAPARTQNSPSCAYQG